MHGETGDQNSGLTGWLSDRTQAEETFSSPEDAKAQGRAARGMDAYK